MRKFVAKEALEKSRRNTEKTEALNAFFTSVFIAKISLQEPWSPERSRKSKARKTLVGGRSGQGTLKQIGYGQGPEGLDPPELTKPALIVIRSFLVFFESSRQRVIVPEDWNVSPLPSEGQDRGSGEPQAAQPELDQRVKCKKELLDSESGHTLCLSQTQVAERGCGVLETLKSQLDNTLNLL